MKKYQFNANEHRLRIQPVPEYDRCEGAPEPIVEIGIISAINFNSQGWGCHPVKLIYYIGRSGKKYDRGKYIGKPMEYWEIEVEWTNVADLHQ